MRLQNELKTTICKFSFIRISSSCCQATDLCIFFLPFSAKYWGLICCLKRTKNNYIHISNFSLFVYHQVGVKAKQQIFGSFFGFPPFLPNTEVKTWYIEKDGYSLKRLHTKKFWVYNTAPRPEIELSCPIRVNGKVKIIGLAREILSLVQDGSQNR